MSGGFWAGAVPPWAFVVGGGLGLVLLLAGMWAGYGRGWKHAEEEARWAREQVAARRVQIPPGQSIVRWRTGDPPPEVAHEAWLAHEDQALTIANYCPDDVPGCNIKHAAITTGEIQAITDETDLMVARWKADNDLWMAEHGLSDS